MLNKAKINVVYGEIIVILAGMKKGTKWSIHSQNISSQDPLVQDFLRVKNVLDDIKDFDQVNPTIILAPFLELIRAEHVTGPLTSLALSAVNKFLLYQLIDSQSDIAAEAAESIADAVTHARFVGTDSASDEVVLMKILQVLRSLLFSQLGDLLSNENVCEILQSTLKVCFETRLTELLRRCAELCLMEMTVLLFQRLKSMAEDNTVINGKRLQMEDNSTDAVQDLKKNNTSSKLVSNQITSADSSHDGSVSDESVPGNVMSSNDEKCDHNIVNTSFVLPSDSLSLVYNQCNQNPKSFNNLSENKEVTVHNEKYTNSQGVHFLYDSHHSHRDKQIVKPYGLPTVRELFRFLITLINPSEQQNNEAMIQVGLRLLSIVLEIAEDKFGLFPSLIAMVKNELCRNIIRLLSTERLALFAAVLRLAFLLFASLRMHLKLQFELFLNKLSDLIFDENIKTSCDHQEVALEFIMRLWKIPGLLTELYLNYDCDLYCSNLFENITKSLSKKSFPTLNVQSVQILCLDSLLTIINLIESRSSSQILNDTHWTLVSNTNENGPSVNKNIFQSSHNLPLRKELLEIKNKKKLLTIGTEHFNIKPEKGIIFLQESGLLSSPLNPVEIATFLRENPRLDKKKIGEYISNRKNMNVLQAFVSSFNFCHLRLDEALRLYLETFRLPGEAPLISLILECFAEFWHKSNNEPFGSADSAFMLSYAIIMLNVDQHNHNVKKQNIPMTFDDFNRNLKGVNNGADFDITLLEAVYNSIRDKEIVMPAEQTGIVKENYLWEALLILGASSEGIFIKCPEDIYDCDLFSIAWGPVLSSLGYILDHTLDDLLLEKLITGFRTFALVAMHHNMSDVFDHLIIALCKFTGLLGANDTAASDFGTNLKSQKIVQCIFYLIQQHGDILRNGWKSLLELLVQLFQLKILPKCLTEVEDFLAPCGKISLIKEDNASSRTESSIFSSFYSYISLGSDSLKNYEDKENIKLAKDAILKCHPEHIITESKFLRPESLQALIQELIKIISLPDLSLNIPANYKENTAVFLLEILIKITIQNRDRAHLIWLFVRDHFYVLIINSFSSNYTFLVERSIVGLMRLAIRLMCREDMASESLKILLMLKSLHLHRLSLHVSSAMLELLKTNAANIHDCSDWSLVFHLLECFGAGAKPPKFENYVNLNVTKTVGIENSQNNDLNNDSVHASERGWTSDSELYYESKTRLQKKNHSNSVVLTSSNSWIAVDGNIKKGSLPNEVEDEDAKCDENAIKLNQSFLFHDVKAFIKSCEALAFIVRDVAHITPQNFESCTHCLRVFVESSLRNDAAAHMHIGSRGSNSHKDTTSRKEKKIHHKKHFILHNYNQTDYDADASGSEETTNYFQTCIQLLDLMHTLHTCASAIYMSWAEDADHFDAQHLWTACWCPLLKGIARLCSDPRHHIRTVAVTYLHRALLVHDLQIMSSYHWEECFYQVLFPLLSLLLLPNSQTDPGGMEETRIRSATLLCKVFLQHLHIIIPLPTFSNLWITILDFMDKYMNADKGELLNEAIPECLKNMILVMETAGIFGQNSKGNELWETTWEKISLFLPNLKSEMLKAKEVNSIAEINLPKNDASNINSLELLKVEQTSLVSCLPDLNSVVPLFTGFRNDPNNTDKDFLALTLVPPNLNVHICAHTCESSQPVNNIIYSSPVESNLNTVTSES